MRNQPTEPPKTAREKPLYRNILIPIDGSVGARRGAEHALDLAARYDATVHVLNVVDEHTHGATPALSSGELVLEKIEEHARAAMDEVASAADRVGIPVVSDCVRGVPHQVISDYAKRNDVDLIVMGIHGGDRGGRGHVGSTTDRVIRTSPVPVLPV